MKLFSFPAAALEKAIHKRVLTLPPMHREWFTERWQQKPYKKSFVENKAMPLVTLIAKGKTWDDATFAEGLQGPLRILDNSAALTDSVQHLLKLLDDAGH